jgi:predicted glycosyltransferase
MKHSLYFNFANSSEVETFAALISEFNKNGIPYEVKQQNQTEITLYWSNGF